MKKSCKKPGISCWAETRRFDTPGAGVGQEGREGRGHRGHPPTPPPKTHTGSRPSWFLCWWILHLPPHLEATGRVLAAPARPPVPPKCPPCHRGALPMTRPWSLPPHLLQGRGWGDPCLAFPVSAFPPRFGAAPCPGTPQQGCPVCLRGSWGTGRVRRGDGGGWWCHASVSPAGRGAIR